MLYASEFFPNTTMDTGKHQMPIVEITMNHNAARINCLSMELKGFKSFKISFTKKYVAKICKDENTIENAAYP